MKIAIAGFGAEGKSAYDYWNNGSNQLAILDERDNLSDLPEGVETRLGKSSFENLADFDMVVRSPSIHPQKLASAKKTWSTTNEFFLKCPAPIIGVTGTKGKGTTSSLIASILRAANKTTHLVGNIGTPAIAELEKVQADDIVVFELSSFQLWDIEKSPHIAIVLGIEPDHLDVHVNMQEYVKAKANIRRYQTLEDACIYHPTNQYSRQVALTGDWPEDDEERRQWEDEARRYGVAGEGQVYEEDGGFYSNGLYICPTDALQIPGRHNIENACAAISAVRYFTIDPEAIDAGLNAFMGLEHRIKFVREVKSVKFYDDSIATTPGSAIAAIHSFKEPKVIILGGRDKGADYSDLLKLCASTKTKVIAIGENSDRIIDEANNNGVGVVVRADTMKSAVEISYDIATPGSIVVLSPAASSFDMFRDYKDRGNHFIAAVQSL